MKPETRHVNQCTDPECIVCLSWREDKRDEARPHLIERLTERTDGSQGTLDDYD